MNIISILVHFLALDLRHGDRPNPNIKHKTSHNVDEFFMKQHFLNNVSHNVDEFFMKQYFLNNVDKLFMKKEILHGVLKF